MNSAWNNIISKDYEDILLNYQYLVCIFGLFLLPGNIFIRSDKVVKNLQKDCE